MSPEERVEIIRSATGVLRRLERDRRASMPPPEREDPSLLREIRDIASLADRLELGLDIEGFDTQAVYARDASVSAAFGNDDVSFLRALLIDQGAGTPYRVGPLEGADREAIAALVDLLARY